MTREQLAAASAAARGLRWVSMKPQDKQTELAAIAAVLKLLESPDATMLNHAVHGYRSDNERNFRAMVRSIR